MSKKNFDKDFAQIFIKQTPDAKYTQTEAKVTILSHLSLRCFFNFRISEVKALGWEGRGCLHLPHCPRMWLSLLKGHSSSGDASAMGLD